MKEKVTEIYSGNKDFTEKQLKEVLGWHCETDLKKERYHHLLVPATQGYDYTIENV
jgi:hypothetical protein